MAVPTAIDLHPDALATQLRVFCGHRTLWIDDSTGRLVHAEPDDLLEAQGLRYVATVLSPTAGELERLLAPYRAPTPDSHPEPTSSESAVPLCQPVLA